MKANELRSKPKEKQMRVVRISSCLIGAGLLISVLGCNAKPAPKPVTSLGPKPGLGIRPYGDEKVKIDMTKIPADLKKVFKYIDDHIDDHVALLQKVIQQPSISNSGEGIPESAEMIKGLFDKLGCQESRVYDMGMTEWGQPGNPVVYAHCDEG